MAPLLQAAVVEEVERLDIKPMLEYLILVLIQYL
jgi:hypothetical protein